MELTTTVQDLFEHYRAFNEAYPILGSMATAGVIFPSSDIASQLISDKKVDWKKVRYTAALAPLYGVLAHLCVRSKELVPDFLTPNRLAESAFGPNLWGNAFNVIFFVNNTVGEKKGYRLEQLAKHYSSIFSRSDSLTRNLKEKIVSYVPRNEYAKATLGTLTLWNVFQCANYEYIPEELQTPATLAMAFGWTIFLSLWSLTGRRKIAEDHS